MDKFNAFKEMMDKIYEGTRTVSKYQSQPRQYGSDITLYMIEVHTLAMIYENEGITVSLLAEKSHKTKSAVTQTVNKLEKKGLVSKLRNQEYHKEINLFTTEAGQQICKYHSELDQKNYENTLKLLTVYNAEDFKSFGDLFEIIYSEINREK